VCHCGALLLERGEIPPRPSGFRLGLLGLLGLLLRVP
jgi:hypothetical protein